MTAVAQATGFPSNPLTMRVAVILDGLLCDTAALQTEWKRRIGDDSFLKDEAFWAALQPYDDVTDFGDAIKGRGWELYLFAERPRSLMLVTRSWVRRRAGLTFAKENVIMQALKRFDARVHKIDAVITGDPSDLDNFKVEAVHPIAVYCCDRSRGENLLDTLQQIAEQ